MRLMTMKLAFALLFSVLLCGCGGVSKSTPAAAAMTPANWVGTWSGQVDWTGTPPNSDDNVSVTIAAPVTFSPDGNPNCLGTETCYVSQFTGTDSGPQCAANGPLELNGSVVTYSGSYNDDPIATASISPGIGGSNGPTCSNFLNIFTGQAWNVSAKSITIQTSINGIVSPGAGTLTKQ